MLVPFHISLFPHVLYLHWSPVSTTVGFYFRSDQILPEYDALQVKRVFDDARGRDSNPQHVLLSGKKGRLCDSVQRVQVTTGGGEKMI